MRVPAASRVGQEVAHPGVGQRRVWLTPYSLYVEPTPSVHFPGIPPRGGRLRLPISPWVARWVMEHAPEAKEVPEVVELARHLDRLPQVAKAPPVEVPTRTGWWPHQAAALGFLTSLLSDGFRGGGLFSDLGTGKTKVAVGLLDHFEANFVLVVGPLSAMTVWHGELRKHSTRPWQIVLPKRSVSVAERLRRIELRRRQVRGVPFLVAMNYEAVFREPFASWAMEQAWDFVVCDELHHAKDPKGRISTFLANLRDRARRRLGMTGTPIAHSPHDVWAQYRFLDPGVFPMSFRDFAKRYQVTRDSFTNRDELEAAMAQIAFRVDNSVLHLPPVLFERRSLPLSPSAMALYRRLERDLVVDYMGGRISRKNALVRLLRLQQVACGHIRDDEGRLHVVDHAKEQMLDELLADVHEPVVVFAEFLYDLDRIREVAERRRLRVGELSGRRNDLAAWQAGELDVLAVQNDAGAEAVDLSRARLGVFYSLGWSLRTWEQSIGRLHRSGQTRPVVFVYLLVEGTLDERKPRFLERRADLVDALLEDLAERYQRGRPEDTDAEEPE